MTLARRTFPLLALGGLTALVIGLAPDLPGAWRAAAQVPAPGAPPLPWPDPPSPAQAERLDLARLAMIRTALALKPGAQYSLWQALEATLRAVATERTRLLAEPPPSPSHPAALLRWESRLLQAESGYRLRLAEALAPLHDSLDDDQRAIARFVLPHLVEGPPPGAAPGPAGPGPSSR